MLCSECSHPIAPPRRRFCSARCKARWHNARQSVEYRRESWLRVRYGITPAEYAAMLAAQDNGCAICGRQPDESYQGKLHVDHCHETGRVRGLLCHNCNQTLGRWQHDPALLRRAADYLEATAS